MVPIVGSISRWVCHVFGALLQRWCAARAPTRVFHAAQALLWQHPQPNPSKRVCRVARVLLQRRPWLDKSEEGASCGPSAPLPATAAIREGVCSVKVVSVDTLRLKDSMQALKRVAIYCQTCHCSSLKDF
jgi:hypothetical protein